MKKRQKTALIFGAACVLLIAVFVGVKLAKNVIPEAGGTEEEKGETLLMLEPEEASEITIHFAGEDISLLKTGDAWALEGHPALPIDQTYPESLVSALAPLEAVRTLESADKKDFGLSPAECTVRVTAGGSVFKVDIGSYNAANSTYYASLEGNDAVYLVSSALGNAAEHPLAEMVLKDAIPDLSELNGLKLEGAGGKASVDYMENGIEGVYTDEYKWAYTDETTEAPSVVGEERLTVLTDLVGAMTWSEVADPLPTEAALAGKYGLASPDLTITFDYVETTEVDSGETDSVGESIMSEEKTDKVFTLKLGRSYENDKGEKLVYALANDSGIVYGISAETADTLKNVNAESLLPTDVLRMDWTTVERMEITAGIVTQRIRISTQLGKNEDGEKVEKLVFTEDDATLDSTLCEEFINYLSEMKAEKTVFGAESQESPVFSMLLKRKTDDAFSEMTFEIRPFDSSFSQVVFNGRAYILVSNRDVEELLLRFNNIR